MEDDKKSCCGLHKVGKIGRAVILSCGVLALLAIGFSWGVSFNNERGVGNFNNEKYHRFDGDRNIRGGDGCQMQKASGGCNQQETDGGCPMQKQAGGCGAEGGGLPQGGGCNMERQFDNNVQFISTTTDTILK
ncbi:MAG: hypothetical protein WAW11_01825 [Patescibacteria group bacterium]